MRSNPAVSEPANTMRLQPAPDLSDYPVREYVRAMSIELAQMALWDGDPQLCKALEAAAEMAAGPIVIKPSATQKASGKSAG